MIESTPSREVARYRLAKAAGQLQHLLLSDTGLNVGRPFDIVMRFRERVAEATAAGITEEAQRNIIALAFLEPNTTTFQVAERGGALAGAGALSLLHGRRPEPT